MKTPVLKASVRDSSSSKLTAAGGFSLIELLVVVLIIGLGVGFISTNIGGNSHYRLQAEAKQFANNVSMVAEEAVLSHQQWGVDLFVLKQPDGDRFGYRWLVRNDRDIWQLANLDDQAVEFLFPEGVALRLYLDGTDQEQLIGFKREVAQRRGITETITNNKAVTVVDGVVTGAAIEPAIWLLSSGEMNSFKLSLSSPDETGRDGDDYHLDIEGDVLGRIVLKTGALDRD